MESFAMSGLWWLPEMPEDQIVGLLAFFPETGFALSIPFGHLGGKTQAIAQFNGSKVIPIVYGMLCNGKKVTIVDVLLKNMEVYIPGAGNEEYSSSLGFIGEKHVETNFYLDRAKISFTYLRDWVVEHPCESIHSEDSLGSCVDYHYRTPAPEELAVGNGWIVSLIHTASGSPASISGFALTHDVEIELKLNSVVGFEKLSTDFISPIWQFFVFCVDRGVNMTKLRIRTQKDEIWMDVGRSQLICDSTTKLLSQSFMMLSRPQLGDRLSSVLTTWLNFSGDVRRAAALLSSIISGKSFSSDLCFLVAAQALETLARVDAKENELNPEEFNRRVKLALDSIQEIKVKNWIKYKLKYANYRGAPDLLQDLVTDLGEFAGKVAPHQKLLLNDIRDNRNFYTHRDPRRSKHILEGEKLFILTQTVVLLLKAAILRRLGFSVNEIMEIMESCQGALQWCSRTAKQYAVGETRQGTSTSPQ